MDVSYFGLAANLRGANFRRSFVRIGEPIFIQLTTRSTEFPQLH
jgi:hypothetical protein